MTRTEIISELENLNLSKESIFYYRDNNYFGYEYDDRYKRCIIGGGFGFNNDPNSKTIPLINLNIYYLHLHELFNPLHSDNSHSDMRPYQHNILFDKTVGEKTYSNFPLTINSKKDLRKLKLLLEQFWKNDAVPFFQYWSDLRSLLPFIETSVPSELAEILSHRLIEKK